MLMAIGIVIVCLIIIGMAAEADEEKKSSRKVNVISVPVKQPEKKLPKEGWRIEIISEFPDESLWFCHKDYFDGRPSITLEELYRVYHEGGSQKFFSSPRPDEVRLYRIQQKMEITYVEEFRRVGDYVVQRKLTSSESYQIHCGIKKG